MRDVARERSALPDDGLPSPHHALQLMEQGGQAERTVMMESTRTRRRTRSPCWTRRGAVGRRFPNTRAGFAAMLAAVAGWPQRQWAVEGARGMGHHLAQGLVAADEVVVDVQAELTTRVRVYSAGHGRTTDRHDAISIARAAVHARRLRHVTRDGDVDALKLLTEHCRELVVARTRAACRLHRLLRELIPGGAPRELSAERAARMLRSARPNDPARLMRRDIATGRPRRTPRAGCGRRCDPLRVPDQCQGPLEGP
jgi:Transposase